MEFESDSDSVSGSGLTQIRISIEYPTQYYLICVPSVPTKEAFEALRTPFTDWLAESEVDDGLKFSCAHTKFSVDPFNTGDLDEFFKMVDDSDLTEAEERHCRMAKVFLPFFTEGREGHSYFAPFWTAFLAGHFYNAEMESLLVDPSQKRAYNAAAPFYRYQCDGVPLTHAFLAVKGTQDEEAGTFKLETSGMSRFGLPELELCDVPAECGPESAYLLRGVAQYMWNAIELAPEDSILCFDSELDLFSSFCEIDKFAASELKGTLLPVALEPSETDADRLVVGPTGEFALSEQWFGAIIGPLRDQRFSLQT